MLDDLKYIHEKDKVDALGIAAKEGKQLEYEFTTDQAPIDIDNIVYAGMGGSALAALISQSWPGYKIPFEIVRNYDIPQYVSERTFFIASSFSGNTEETISAINQAKVRQAKIAVISGGGKLVEIARENNYPLVLLPPAEQPRYAVYYSLKALITLLSKAGIISSPSEVNDELAKAATFINEEVESWLPTVKTENNLAKQIALDVTGKSAVIYAGPKLFPAAYKWKISFNENAKHIAWTNQYPEFNHNEFMGWTEQPVTKPYYVIDLQSSFENLQIQKRFGLTRQLLSGRRPEPIVINVKGHTLIEQLLWTITLGDFATIYTALVAGIDPAPVELIEKFKKLLV